MWESEQPIYNVCEVQIENSVTRVTVQHRETCRVISNRYQVWQNFQFTPNNHYVFYFLLTLPLTIVFNLEYA